jgi:hypothetical protein
LGVINSTNISNPATKKIIPQYRHNDFESTLMNRY